MENTLYEAFTRYIWVPAVAYFWHRQRKQDDIVEDLKTSVTKLEVTAVNEEKVRHVVHEVIEPIQQDTKEIKTTLNTIAATMTQMQVDAAKKNS